MGNRGCLHDHSGRIVRSHRTHAWITCVLSFKGRRRQLMSPGRYTELFFLDEATALAAGHRPCFECRRADARAFAEAFSAGNGLAARPKANELDAVLRPHRLPLGRARPTWTAHPHDLPDGAMVRLGSDAALVVRGSLRRWSFDGYGMPEPLPHNVVEVLTPEPTVRALAACYVPGLHPSATSPDPTLGDHAEVARGKRRECVGSA